VPNPSGVTEQLVCSSPTFLELVGANLASTGINLGLTIALVVLAAVNRQRIRRWLSPRD
jgi:hypothetical protein